MVLFFHLWAILKHSLHAALASNATFVGDFHQFHRCFHTETTLITDGMNRELRIAFLKIFLRLYSNALFTSNNNLNLIVNHT